MPSSNLCLLPSSYVAPERDSVPLVKNANEHAIGVVGCTAVERQLDAAVCREEGELGEKWRERGGWGCWWIA